MADVVRLSIVYDTGQAASRLNALNGQLGATHVSTKKLGVAAVGLAQELATGGASAAGLTSKLATLGGKAGAIGIVLAVIVGVLAIFKHNADKARDAAAKFADQIRDTNRSVDDLLRSDIRSPLQTQIEKITDAITTLDRELSKQRSGGLWDILKAMALGIGHGLADPASVWTKVTKLWQGGEDPATRRARDDQARELDRLKPENLAGAMMQQTFNNANRISEFSGLTRGLFSDEAAEKVKGLSDELKGLLEILPEDSAQVQSVAKSFRQWEDAARRTLRAENLMRSGLEELANTLEDFIVTGTAAFTDFLDNILRLLYRDFTGELIHNLVRSVYGGSGGDTQGAGKDTAGIVKSGMSPSVATNVTFNVTAIDSQGVAQFFDQHGPRIAAVVAGQADRSRGIRRRFLRG